MFIITRQLFECITFFKELITGNISNNGPYQNGDKDNKAFVSWIPDPVGADPSEMICMYT